MSTKVLVTGSRDFTDWATIYGALQELSRPLIVIHGDARGADRIADFWATSSSGVSAVRVPADWANDGKSGGHIRNSRMLELGPDLVLAFFQHGSPNKGTSGMVALSEKAGIEVRKYWNLEEPDMSGAPE
jgi:YspA, cpYpsA-related SLOG family